MNVLFRKKFASTILHHKSTSGLFIRQKQRMKHYKKSLLNHCRQLTMYIKSRNFFSISVKNKNNQVSGITKNFCNWTSKSSANVGSVVEANIKSKITKQEFQFYFNCRA